MKNNNKSAGTGSLYGESPSEPLVFANGLTLKEWMTSALEQMREVDSRIRSDKWGLLRGKHTKEAKKYLKKALRDDEIVLARTKEIVLLLDVLYRTYNNE